VADPCFNGQKILDLARKAYEQHCVVLPGCFAGQCPFSP
jgi:hypothetical protein